jgi:hypothetical protein
MGAIAVTHEPIVLADERPPAGTACSPCKTLGHYCPAVKYIGATDDGICTPCAEQKKCPVGERGKHKGDEDIFDPALSHAAVGRTLGVSGQHVGRLRKELNLGCQAQGCKRNAEKGWSFCSHDHYDELVAERKRRAGKTEIVMAVPAKVLEAPSRSASYDAVIRDLEAKVAAIQMTIDALKVLRGEP